MLKAIQRLNETPQIQPVAPLLGWAVQGQELLVLKVDEKAGLEQSRLPSREDACQPFVVVLGSTLTPLATRGY